VAETKNPMQTQRKEFDAFAVDAKSFNTLCSVAIVDDDYPMVRHRFESDLTALITAMRENDRFGPGNPYRIYALPAAQQPTAGQTFERGDVCVYSYRSPQNELLKVICTYLEESEGWHRVALLDGSSAVVPPGHLSKWP